MDQDSQRVPAWKRLGLSLRRDDQSGNTVPDPQRVHGLEQSGEADGGLRGRKKDLHSSAGPTENGKSSALGKRKHEHAQAEEHGKPLKKSKKSEEHSQSNGAAGFASPDTAKEENDKPESLPEKVPASDKQRPKGDPNYRKKKGQRINSSKSEKSVSGSPQHGIQLMKANEKEQDYEQSRVQNSHKPSRIDPPSPSDVSASRDEDTLVVSTETVLPPSPPVHVPRESKKTNKLLGNVALNSSPLQADRRKSVTFTPDTKTTDGNSASNFFKKWVTEQKGADAEFTPAEVAQFAPPLKLHPANELPTSQSLNLKEKQLSEKASKETAKKQKQGRRIKPGESKEEKEPTPPLKSAVQTDKPGIEPASKSKGRRKDPSIYLTYLSQYYNNRTNWKFNKAKQNDLLDNALNIFRIPEKYSDALSEYIRGLKGAGVIERLKDKCATTIEGLDKDDTQDPSIMNDSEARKAAKEEALEERMIKERERRTTDADIEALQDHPYPEGFIRRLKRRRAQALLSALNMTSPAPHSSIAQVNSMSDGTTSVLANTTASQRRPRKRKRRDDVIDDESSSSESSSSSSVSSSSKEPSSDESDDQDSDSNSNSESDDSGSNDGGNDSSGDPGDDNQSKDSEDVSSSETGSGSSASEDGDSENSESD